MIDVLLDFLIEVPPGSGSGYWIASAIYGRPARWVSCSPLPADPAARAKQAAARVATLAERPGWLPPEERGAEVQLTPLGRRLLGAETW
jgi:hypothetical protein